MAEGVLSYSAVVIVPLEIADIASNVVKFWKNGSVPFSLSSAAASAVLGSIGAVVDECSPPVVASVLDDWTTLAKLSDIADACSDDVRKVNLELWEPSSVETVYAVLVLSEGVTAEAISLKSDVDEEDSSILSFENVEGKNFSVVDSLFERVGSTEVLIETGCEVVDGLYES